MAWRSHRRDGLRLQSANCSPLDHGITATSLWPSAALDSAHLQGMAWQLHIRLTLESSNEDDVYYGTSSTGLCTRTKGMGLQLVPSENCPPVLLANRITHFASPHKRTMQLLLSFLHCPRDVLDLDVWKSDVIQTCEQRSERFRDSHNLTCSWYNKHSQTNPTMSILQVVLEAVELYARWCCWYHHGSWQHTNTPSQGKLLRK